MSDVVERARRIMGLYGEDFAAYVALRDLLAEIDSGVWLDTRELDALAEAGTTIIPEGRSRMHRWEVWVNNDGPVTTHSTFADAVRAAREAANA